MLNIALNTFKEIIRNKILYFILVFAFLFILFSLLLSNLTIGEGNKIILDFGIAMIEIFGIISVLFVGSQLLFKEIDGKTIFLILSKPINRYEFIIGKFLGFGAIIKLIFFFQSILYLAILYYKGIGIDLMIIYSLVFILFKLLILLVIVLFFSTFMSNILTIIVSILVYFVGHSFTLIIDLATKTGSVFILNITKFLNIIFPPLEALNIKDYIGGFVNFSFNYFLINSFYAIFYIFIILFFTVLIFSKKRFDI